MQANLSQLIYHQDRAIFLLFKLFHELRNHFVQVPNNTVIRHFKNRGVWVFVDSYNTFTGLHTRQVLDRARNAAGDIESWSNGLTGLTYLLVMICPTRVNRCT